MTPCIVCREPTDQSAGDGVMRHIHREGCVAALRERVERVEGALRRSGELDELRLHEMGGMGARMSDLSGCVSEAHAIVWKLLDPRANIDLSPDRLAAWTNRYRALILATSPEPSDADAIETPMTASNCPRCGSPSPGRHPAVQYEGEVEMCSDVFHDRVTSANTPERIAARGPLPPTPAAP